MEDKLICAAWGLVMQVRKYRLLPRKHAAIYTKMRPPQPQSHFQCKPYCYSIPLMHHCLPHHPHVLLFWSSPLTAALAEWPDCSLPGEACAGSYQKLFSKDDLFPLLQQIQCSKLLVIRSAAQSKEMTLTKHEAFRTLLWRFHISSSTEAPSPDLHSINHSGDQKDHEQFAWIIKALPNVKRSPFCCDANYKPKHWHTNNGICNTWLNILPLQCHSLVLHLYSDGKQVKKWVFSPAAGCSASTSLHYFWVQNIKYIILTENYRSQSNTSSVYLYNQINRILVAFSKRTQYSKNETTYPPRWFTYGTARLKHPVTLKLRTNSGTSTARAATQPYSPVFRPWQRHGPVFLCGLSGLALFRRRSTHWTEGPE